jgi:hypothetical protein
MKLSRPTGPAGGPASFPEGPDLKAADPAAAASARRNVALPAETVYTQARHGHGASAATGGGPASQLRGEGAPLLRNRPEDRAPELARRLESAPPETKGVELARIHGQAALRRVQRLLAPAAERLGTALGPAGRVAFLPPDRVSLSPAQTDALRSASSLAAESLGLEDLGLEPLTATLADRVLFQLDLVHLGRGLDDGFAEVRTAAQRALAALAL